MTKEISLSVGKALASDQPEPFQRIEDERSPDAVCELCRFARLMRASPNDIQKQLVCKLNPPQNIVGAVGGQPTIVGAANPVVHPRNWCYQFEAVQVYSPALKNS